MGELVRIGPDEIKAGYEMYSECPYYALFEIAFKRGVDQSGGLLYKFTGDDRSEGWDQLKSNLDIIAVNTPTSQYMIRFYDDLNKKGSIDTSTPYSGSFRFKMSKESYQPATMGAAGSGNQGVSFMNELFAAKLENFNMQWQHKFEEQERRHQEELLQLAAEQEAEDEDEDMGAIGTARDIVDVVGEAGNKYPWLRENINKLFSTVNDFLVVGKYKVKQHLNEPQRAASMGKVEAGASAAVDPLVSIDQSTQIIMSWYFRKAGLTEQSSREEKLKAAEQMAYDFQCLASATEDDDVMELALTKLRKLA